MYSNLEQSRALSYSAPSAINLEHSVVKFEGEVERARQRRGEAEAGGDSVDDSGEGCDMSSDSELMHNSVTEHSVSPHEHWQSLSCLTDSTEQSAPVNFDMSNRVSSNVRLFVGEATCTSTISLNLVL